MSCYQNAADILGSTLNMTLQHQHNVLDLLDPRRDVCKRGTNGDVENQEDSLSMSMKPKINSNIMQIGLCDRSESFLSSSIPHLHMRSSDNINNLQSANLVINFLNLRTIVNSLHIISNYQTPHNSRIEF